MHRAFERLIDLLCGAEQKTPLIPNPKRITRDAPFNFRLFEYYKECYYFEVEQKDRVVGKSGLIMATLTLAANIGLYYFKNLPPITSNVTSLIFDFLFIAAIFFAAIGAIYLVRLVGVPFRGHRYAYVPSPNKIQDFLKQAEIFNPLASTPDQIDLNDAFDENLLEQFSTCATENATANHLRNNFVYRSHSFIIAALVCFLFAGIPFFLLKNPWHEEPIKVKIEEPIKLQTMKEREIRSDAPPRENAVPILPSTEFPDIHIKLQPDSKPEWPGITMMTEAQEHLAAEHERGDDDGK